MEPVAANPAPEKHPLLEARCVCRLVSGVAVRHLRGNAVNLEPVRLFWRESCAERDRRSAEDHRRFASGCLWITLAFVVAVSLIH